MATQAEPNASNEPNDRSDSSGPPQYLTRIDPTRPFFADVPRPPGQVWAIRAFVVIVLLGLLAAIVLMVSGALFNGHP